jgi:amino acid permease
LAILIIVAFAMVLGVGPTGSKQRGETYRDYPVFKIGFKGFTNAALLAI